jgi:uncharacterized protein with HEPN domain
MSKRVPSIVINDILYCIDHVTTYTANLSFEDFTSNFMVIEACLYNIQIIGEAVAQLPDDVKNDLPTFKSHLQLIQKSLTEEGR